jgi:hypothetical protein
MKFFISFLLSIVVALLIGVGLYTIAGIDPFHAAGIFFILKAVYLFAFSHKIPKVAAFAGVNKEIWIDVLKEKFYRSGDFLDGVNDWSAFVEFNTINFADSGGDPEVLVNNTTYPINTAQRTDTAKTIALDTYDTENTRVRNVEEIEAAYNKLESVVKQHRNAIRQKYYDKAIHAYGPSADGTNTPIIQTSGTADVALAGLTGSFKRCTLKDIMRLQEKWDLLDYPEEGRVLVLHPSHIKDLLAEDSALFKAFAQLESGRLINMFGFKLKKYSNTPLFVEAALTKVAFGTAKDAATHTISSIAFLEIEVMKAEGTVEMFWKPKDINTEQRADEVGFQMRAIALPERNVSISAIVSDK